MSVLISAKHGLVGVPAHPAIFNAMPDAKAVTHNGNTLALVRHGRDETLFLRNLGFNVPSPVLTHYDWEGGKPFEAQKNTAALLTMNRRAYVLNDFGTGKTRATLWAWRYLNRRGEAGKLLVVAPLSTLNFTWAHEVFSTLPGVRVAILHGTRQKRLARLEDPDVDVYVINHDGLAIIADALAERDDINCVVLDELAAYRNGTATRTKRVKAIVRNKKWVWGLTGSPMPNAPTDAWAQCSIITPNTVPKYFTRFRDEVMTKVSQFRWVPKRGAIDRVFEVMQPAVRYSLDDVVELPEIVERTIDIDLGAKQQKVYKQMEKHAYTLVDSKEITAINAGVVLNKLLQISTGYIYARDRTVVSLDNDARLNAIVDIINSTGRKVIVFVPFVHALEGVAEKLTSEGYEVRTVSGSTSKAERDEAFSLFQNTDRVKVLVAHPQTMSHGLTLHAADTIVWAAPITSLETFIQANARIRRVGQKHRQQIVMLQATEVEKRTYAKLRNKEQALGVLLDLYAEATSNQ